MQWPPVAQARSRQAPAQPHLGCSRPVPDRGQGEKQQQAKQQRQEAETANSQEQAKHHQQKQQKHATKCLRCADDTTTTQLLLLCPRPLLQKLQRLPLLQDQKQRL